MVTKKLQKKNILLIGAGLSLLLCILFITFRIQSTPLPVPINTTDTPASVEPPGITEEDVMETVRENLPGTEVAATDGSWQSYTTSDGLPHNEISTVEIDELGRIWVAGRGLSSFDGRSWTTYPGPAQVIYDIAIGSNGHIWCATPRGLLEFDGNNWSQHLRAGSPVDNWVEVVEIDPTGRIWVGFNSSDGGGVGLFEGETWTLYGTAAGLVGNHIKAITSDQMGNVWVGYGPYSQGASRFNGESWLTYTTIDGLAHNWVNDIVVDQKGAVWFATGSGVSHFSNAIWTTYNRTNGFSADLATSIALGPAGQVWVGAFDGQAEGVAISSGVRVLAGERWRSYNKTVGLAGNGVGDIAFATDGQIWLATSAGVSRFRPAAPQSSTPAVATSVIPPSDEPLSIFDIPLPDDAQAIDYQATAQQMSYTTDSSLDRLVTLYRRRLPERGWQEDTVVALIISDFASLRFTNGSASLALTLSKIAGNRTEATIDGNGLLWER